MSFNFLKPDFKKSESIADLPLRFSDIKTLAQLREFLRTPQYSTESQESSSELDACIEDKDESLDFDLEMLRSLGIKKESDYQQILLKSPPEGEFDFKLAFHELAIKIETLIDYSFFNSNQFKNKAKADKEVIQRNDKWIKETEQNFNKIRVDISQEKLKDSFDGLSAAWLNDFNSRYFKEDAKTKTKPGSAFAGFLKKLEEEYTLDSDDTTLLFKIMTDGYVREKTL